MPGGLHPFAFLFLEIDPSLADFNIHPAKKEVRFKDPEGPRRAIYSAVQAFLGELVRRDPAQAMPDPSAVLELGLRPFEGYASASPGRPSWEDFDAVRERADSGTSPSLPSPPAERDFRYLGHALGPFLVFERAGAVWFLDQHAAHERMLFDRLMARPPESQPLLVAEEIEPEDDAEDERIAAAARGLGEAGFRVEREEGRWLVTAAPPELSGGAAQAIRELAREIAVPRAQNADPRESMDPRRAVYALAACRAAVKDGETLDDASAEELIAAALELPQPRCPHGRPIWTRITREQLYRLVQREV